MYVIWSFLWLSFNFLQTNLLLFLVQAVDHVPSLLTSESNDGAPRLTPAKYDLQIPDESVSANSRDYKWINKTNCDFQIPGTTQDDFFSHVDIFCDANTNKHPSKTQSHELVSFSIAFFNGAQSSSQDLSTMDTRHRKAQESSAGFSANMCPPNEEESETTTSDNSSLVNKMPHTSLHESISDNPQPIRQLSSSEGLCTKRTQSQLPYTLLLNN